LKYFVSKRAYSDKKLEEKKFGSKPEKKNNGLGKLNPIASFLVRKNFETHCLISAFYSAIIP
jgi:hypothetical protein